MAQLQQRGYPRQPPEDTPEYRSRLVDFFYTHVPYQRLPQCQQPKCFLFACAKKRRVFRAQQYFEDMERCAYYSASLDIYTRINAIADNGGGHTEILRALVFVKRQQRDEHLAELTAKVEKLERCIMQGDLHVLYTSLARADVIEERMPLWQMMWTFQVRQAQTTLRGIKESIEELRAEAVIDDIELLHEEWRTLLIDIERFRQRDGDFRIRYDVDNMVLFPRDEVNSEGSLRRHIEIKVHWLAKFQLRERSLKINARLDELGTARETCRRNMAKGSPSETKRQIIARLDDLSPESAKRLPEWGFDCRAYIRAYNREDNEWYFREYLHGSHLPATTGVFFPFFFLFSWFMSFSFVRGRRYIEIYLGRTVNGNLRRYLQIAIPRELDFEDADFDE